MAHVEPPCRQLLPVGELGVRVGHLRDGVQVGRLRSPVGIIGVTAAGVDDLDIAQGHVVDIDSRDAENDGRRDVPGQVFHRSLVAVTLVGLRGGDFRVQVLDGHVTEDVYKRQLRG